MRRGAPITSATWAVLSLDQARAITVCCIPYYSPIEITFRDI